MIYVDIKNAVLVRNEEINPLLPPPWATVSYKAHKNTNQKRYTTIVLDSTNALEIEATIQLVLQHTAIYKNLEELAALWQPIKTHRLLYEGVIQNVREIKYIDLTIHTSRDNKETLRLESFSTYRVPRSVMYPNHEKIVKNNLELNFPAVVEKLQIEEKMMIVQKEHAYPLNPEFLLQDKVDKVSTVEKPSFKI